jgi:UDP-N-acetylglucosamine:LPS N-acetylglucosamine transferase
MKMKICIVASAGGHLTELLSLEEVWEEKDHFLITTEHFITQSFEKNFKSYIVSWSNRNHLLLFFKMMIQCVKIIIKERPTIILSTGAAVGCVTCLIGKLLGTKIIWIDTLCYIEKVSLSGKIIRPFSDLFLVQWPDLEDKKKGIQYLGSIV